jgi:DNA polymerase-1
LIDASPYLFRAWFALPEMLSPAGAPMSAVYGFAGFLLKYIRDEKPTHLGVAFDESLTTSFRNDLHPGYKASRDLPPPELEAQQKDCRLVAEALGAATFVSPRYEADDLIGTLANSLLKDGHRLVVVSSDKDLCQLVSERVEFFDFARDRRFGPAEVEEKFGVPPEGLRDWLALAGDPVDDIPGVTGIGAKGAASLLQAFGNLDAMYQDLEAVAAADLPRAKSLARRLSEGHQDALLSRELATIAKDAPIKASVGELAWNGANRALTEPLFARLGIEGLARRVERWL